MRKQPPFQLRLNKDLSDLNPVVVGEGSFSPGDQSNTLVSEAYLIHYVRCGSGIYHHKGIDHIFRSGQLIISRPGDVAQFGPAEEARWTLRWIGFNGKLAHRFSELPIIVDAPPVIRTVFMFSPPFSSLSSQIAPQEKIFHESGAGRSPALPLAHESLQSSR